MLLQMCTLGNPQLIKIFLFTVPSKIRVFNMCYSVHFVILQVYRFFSNSFNECLLFSFFFPLFLVAMTTELKCTING